MSKLIQAYFRTEDDAEGARTSLLAYNTEQLEVGALQEGISSRTNLLVPLVPWTTNTGGGGSSATTGVFGGGPVMGVAPLRDTSPTGAATDQEPATADAVDDLMGNDNDELRYVLSAKVQDEDYEEIVQKLRENHAYVERLDD